MSGAEKTDDYLSTDWPDIIAELRLEAGRIMEDTSDGLAMRAPENPAAVAVLLRKERLAADDIRSLLAAAQVLHRRCVILD